ncbi:MAG: FAD:protein FMN transferase [Eubacteriales bacterium]|nr:FAD:protein FMN transferase [Eubacteriales bacterium]
MKKRGRILCFCVCLILLLPSCRRSDKQLYKDEFFGAFDTICGVSGYAQTAEQFEEHFVWIRERLLFYSRHYDIYQSYEGITNIKDINAMAGKKAVKVHPVIFDLLKLGKEVYEESGGNVNIAFGSVLRIWHQYREEALEYPEKAALPSSDILQEANLHTKIEDIILDEKAQTVFLKDEKMSLDVGALAKGYAVERVALEMEERGLTGYLINAGGNIRAIGSKANGQKWKVGIQNPDTASPKPYLDVVLLEKESLVTSGSYQRFYEVGNIRYHHIIDKDTLMPSKYFESVSVIGNAKGKEDAISTALFNMPLEKGMKWLEGIPEVAAVWILPDGEKVYSSRVQRFLAK